ncbi:PE-PGRS family protein [Streptomyces sp. BHT-5-2]|uniref:PE-PGRS family protein n=1 Tax=Streptomyces sp. BHT-5-2 TaxID=2866715 RepID=UPI0021B15652|nr:PE-PGRS family protein [Streptomyces sp. BHT-5-2]
MRSYRGQHLDESRRTGSATPTGTAHRTVTRPSTPPAAGLAGLQSVLGNQAVALVAEQRAAQGRLSGLLTGRDSSARQIGTREISDREVRKVLTKRLTEGPVFSADELRDIQILSRSPKWLDDIGIGRYEDAEKYTEKGDYRTWLRLKPGQRLLIATLEWTRRRPDEGGPTPTSPAYTLGRHLALRGGSLPDDARRSAEEERDRQIHGTFVDTLDTRTALLPDDPDAWRKDARARTILTHVFLILQNGLKVYKEGAGHIDFREGDVARALAHGGRVNIRIPQLEVRDSAFALTDWLGLTRDGGHDVDPAERRAFGTHHMKIGENKDGVAGKFREQGGTLASVKNVVQFGSRSERVRLYGLDLAAGGLGSRDFNGDVVLPDGGHGHMFVGFTPPRRNRDGALQVGIETTSPGGPSPVGYQHTWRSTEATANPESSFYGHKKDKIGEGKLAVNQRYVDLGEFRTPTGGGWMRFLEELKEDWARRLAAAETDPVARRALYSELTGRRRDE